MLNECYAIIWRNKESKRMPAITKIIKKVTIFDAIFHKMYVCMYGILLLYVSVDELKLSLLNLFIHLKISLNIRLFDIFFMRILKHSFPTEICLTKVKACIITVTICLSV